MSDKQTITIELKENCESKKYKSFIAIIEEAAKSAKLDLRKECKNKNIVMCINFCSNCDLKK